ncbi:MAG: hypothetical protein QNJ57_10805 [Flavobacteriaceae bacterium]|nr:hypothetical protein [Flavobacteriaceae bacterium]
MKKLSLTLIISCLFMLIAFTKQDHKDSKAQSFFDEVTKGSGIWVANHVNFNKNDANGFPKFILEFKRLDRSSLWAKIKGINQKNDTVLFWEIWEFVDVPSGRTKITQRSPAGHYGYGEASFESDIKRISELSLNFTNGASSKHKSSHELVDSNLLISISKNYDDKTKTWVETPAQEWKRVQ